MASEFCTELFSTFEQQLLSRSYPPRVSPLGGVALLCKVSVRINGL